MLRKNVPKTDDVRRKLLLGVLGSPVTLMPLVAGITAFLGAWAVDLRLDLGMLAVMAGVLGSAGMFVTQLLLGGEARAKAALEEVQQEMAEAAESRLNQLDRALRKDDDPRTEAVLRDLRLLAEALDKASEPDPENPPLPMVVSIRADAEALFEQCIRSLERTLEFWHTARSMRTKAARTPILEKREQLLAEILESIRHMGRLLVSLQELQRGEHSEPDLGRIRKELDDNLAVAKRVDANMRAFDRELNGESPE